MKYLLSTFNFQARKKHRVSAQLRLFTFSFFLFSSLSAQTITNVQARQEGFEIIITYDMEGELHEKEEIMLGISTDGGQNYKPVSNAYGDIGKHVKPGRNKEIYFLVDDALGGKDAKFKVYADVKAPPGMVYVEGGTFQMGSNSGASDEKPIHTVTVSSFFMDKTEVTQAQYRKVMGNNPSHFSGCDECPVESVSWHDANEYAKKVGKRLPTEAEWEYAARGGSTGSPTTYAGSNDLGALGWYSGNSGRKTHPVGQKDPNELGLYDMSGNVWEWCSDRYDSDYYKNSPKNNPKGPNSGAARVLRGGSWHYRIMSITAENIYLYKKWYNIYQTNPDRINNSQNKDNLLQAVGLYQSYIDSLAEARNQSQGLLGQSLNQQDTEGVIPGLQSDPNVIRSGSTNGDQQAIQSQQNLYQVMGIQQNTGVADRSRNYPDDGDYSFGFRLVSQD